MADYRITPVASHIIQPGDQPHAFGLPPGEEDVPVSICASQPHDMPPVPEGLTYVGDPDDFRRLRHRAGLHGTEVEARLWWRGRGQWSPPGTMTGNSSARTSRYCVASDSPLLNHAPSPVAGLTITATPGEIVPIPAPFDVGQSFAPHPAGMPPVPPGHTYVGAAEDLRRLLTDGGVDSTPGAMWAGGPSWSVGMPHLHGDAGTSARYCLRSDSSLLPAPAPPALPQAQESELGRFRPTPDGNAYEVNVGPGQWRILGTATTSAPSSDMATTGTFLIPQAEDVSNAVAFGQTQSQQAQAAAREAMRTVNVDPAFVIVFGEPVSRLSAAGFPPGRLMLSFFQDGFARAWIESPAGLRVWAVGQRCGLWWPAHELDPSLDCNSQGLRAATRIEVARRAKKGELEDAYLKARKREEEAWVKARRHVGGAHPTPQGERLVQEWDRTMADFRHIRDVLEILPEKAEPPQPAPLNPHAKGRRKLIL